MLTRVVQALPKHGWLTPLMLACAAAVLWVCRYVLLRGRKRFRLWDPSVAGQMPTVGQLRRVHANGRAEYVGQVSGGWRAPRACAWHGVPAAGRLCQSSRFMCASVQEETCADGSGAKEAAALLARRAAESRLDAAERAVQRGHEVRCNKGVGRAGLGLCSARQVPPGSLWVA